jgi:hypothetical protein
MTIFVKYRPSCNMMLKIITISQDLSSNLLNKQSKEFSGDLNFRRLLLAKPMKFVEGRRMNIREHENIVCKLPF